MRKILTICAVVVLSISVVGMAGATSMFQAGGERLVTLQNTDGGWDWPLDDGNPSNASPKNTIGPIGMGLAQAYLQRCADFVN